MTIISAEPMQGTIINNIMVSHSMDPELRQQCAPPDILLLIKCISNLLVLQLNFKTETSLHLAHACLCVSRISNGAHTVTYT